MDEPSNIILIAGPTASGKSQLAAAIAQQHDSVIINTDSMQVYADLHILTARPSKSETQRLPHALYGFVDGGQAFSVGIWLNCVRDLLNAPDIRKKQVIFVGGTGLYFRALGGGLSAMPEIAANIRQYWRARLDKEGAVKLHAELLDSDPIMAQRVRPTDGQRIIRALEIRAATGQSLEFWQAQKSPALVDMTKATKFLILPERERLYERINARFDKMLSQGVLDEVEKLLKRQLDTQLPIMKAIGVRELGGLLRGDLKEQEAIARAKQETRRYAKRQMSWFRNMLAEKWQIFSDIEKIVHNF